MMNRRCLIRVPLSCLVGLVWIMAPSVSADQSPPTFTPPVGLRVIPGTYSPTEFPPDQPDGTNGMAVDPASPFATLPVLSKALEREVAEMPADEMLRVIIMLRHLPQDRISAEVQTRHTTEKAAIDTEVDTILEATAARRDPTLPRDADNHPELIKAFPQEREALRPLNLRREALDKAIIDEMIPEIAVELAPYFDRVRSAVEELGGEFGFSTIAGSLVVARVPAGKISSLAEHPDILRISTDVLFHSTLDIMDDATLVSAPGGLWDSGFDGGIFDPAIIDTGTDIYHPGMTNSTSPARENFYTWFLTAAAAEPTFNDVTTQDDLQGHGTHVAGIVGCYGSSGYEDHLGMAYGVEKLVTLKAGWRDTSGGGKIKLTDMCGIVDRALNHSGDLFPQGTFGDDVDGMNLSFAGETTEDETGTSRFFDSVISSYPDLPVTIAAGNSGPDNVNFMSAASSYNAITVGNASDRATPDRADDIISPTSTAGPTAYGRRKPDLAAPGTNIKAPYNEWDDMVEFHYITKSGTSMSAPAVLGVIMSLMDAGVADELALKALLINTAQKNDAGIDIESDPDGWDPQIGFGYMNALAAFGHRSDIFQGVVTPRDSFGDYRLFKGVMRDEGPTGEGRDRATMVWNRHATYTPAAPPTTYFDLTDINLQLYHEDDGTLVDSDVTPLDNVQQVRIESGAAATPVVIKAYAWSTSFTHGGPDESFALATEEGFSQVILPGSFTGEGSWPSSVEPDEIFVVGFRVRNDSETTSHNNTFDLDLPSGWSLVTGNEIQIVGSAPGSSGTSAYAVWEIRAPSLNPPGPEIFPIEFSHYSYGESWGTVTYDIHLTLGWDTTSPLPDPMFFSIAPAPDGLSEIAMQAVEATDVHEPVDYLHEYRSSPTGGAGGSSSGWQLNRDYTDRDLTPNNEYCYRVLARDSATTPNNTAPSADTCTYTMIETPAAPLPTATTTTVVNLQLQGSFNNLDQGSSGLKIDNTTQGTTSGWVQGPVNWDSIDLGTNSPYEFVARSRNGNGLEAPVGPSASVFTLIEAPLVPIPTVTGPTTVDVLSQGMYSNLGDGSSGLRIDNLTAGTDSGWMQSQVSWTSNGLTPNTECEFVTRSRNGDAIENPPAPGASVVTWAAPPSAIGFATVTHQSVTARWSANGNPTGTEFLAENLTTGADSGWTTSIEWLDSSTGPSSIYDYQVRARNLDGMETAIISLGAIETGFFGDGFEGGNMNAWSTTVP